MFDEFPFGWWEAVNALLISYLLAGYGRPPLSEPYFAVVCRA